MNGWSRPSDHGDTAREDAEARYEAAEEEMSWPPEEENFVATCDWGDCDDETAGFRRDAATGINLSVCRGHLLPTLDEFRLLVPHPAAWERSRPTDAYAAALDEIERQRVAVLEWSGQCVCACEYCNTLADDIPYPDLASDAAIAALDVTAIRTARDPFGGEQ
jgi:hypothetical protein